MTIAPNVALTIATATATAPPATLPLLLLFHICIQTKKNHGLVDVAGLFPDVRLVEATASSSHATNMPQSHPSKDQKKLISVSSSFWLEETNSETMQKPRAIR